MHNRFDGKTIFMLALMFLALLSFMLAQVLGAPAYVDHTWFGYDVNTQYATDDTVKFGHIVSAGDNRLLTVLIGCGFNETVTSVLWGDGGTAQSLTLAKSRAAAAGWRTEVWYLVAPTVRSDTIYVDYTGIHSGATYGALNFTNVSQGSPIGATADSSRGDEGIEPIVFLTTIYDSSYVLTACTQHGANSGPHTPSTGQIEVYNATPGVLNWDPYSWCGYIERLSAGSQACSLDATGSDPDDDWAIVSVEIHRIPTGGDGTLVSPAAATAAATAVNPSVFIGGSLSIAPGIASAIATSSDPVIGGEYPSGNNIFYMAPPFPSSGLRAGNDTYAGNHPDTAFATLAHALGQIGAGDTLFVMGGVYFNIQQNQLTSGSLIGTVNDPIVIKAYGDSVAHFCNPGQDGVRGSKKFFYSGSGHTCQNFVLDGVPFLDSADSLYLSFYIDSGTTTWEEVGRTIAGSQAGLGFIGDENIVVRGIEFSMQGIYARCRGYGSGSGCGPDVGFFLQNTDHILIERNYMHHFHRPTNCWTNGEILGDSTHYAQGSGRIIGLNWCDHGVMRYNTFERANHDAIRLGGCKYWKCIQNLIDQHQGGYLYVVCASGDGDYDRTSYCLFDGNIFTNSGRSTSFLQWEDWPVSGTTCYPKRKGWTFGGHNSTVRRNAVFSRHNHGISLTGEVDYSTNRWARENFIYNNTFYKGVNQSLNIEIRSGGYVEQNRIFNNIFYDADMERHGALGTGDYPVIRVYDGSSASDPASWGEDPTETHWGYNYFHNNLWNRDSIASGPHYGSDHATFMQFNSSSGGWQDHTLTELQAGDTVSWKDNIAVLPDLVTVDPNTFGVKNRWWELSGTSPCIDAGRRVTGDFADTNGTYVTNNAESPPAFFATYGVTTYGWPDTISWFGTAPDIGAYENTEGTAVAPAAASAAGTAVNPAVVLGPPGSELIAPDVATAAGTGANPAVLFGSTSVAPVVASAKATAVDPNIAGEVTGMWARFGVPTHGFDYRGRRF